MVKFPKAFEGVLEYCLKRVVKNRRFWPTELAMQLAHAIMSVTAFEVVVWRRRPDGKVEWFLMWRDFKEWPKKYRKPGWYFAGGYAHWLLTMQESCLKHIQKDLANECRRTGQQFEDRIVFGTVTQIAASKWLPGEHPFGCPTSVLCAVELLEGELPVTDRTKWVTEVMPTDVPRHEHFQRAVRAYFETSKKFREQLAAIQSLANA